MLPDIAAIEVEIEQIDSMLKADNVRSQQSCAGCQPLPPDHLLRIEHWHKPASRQCE
ncbi:hypothetical protein [Nitrosomonas mobilis]|uniref:Uncharacterized protein n=1 Tax=Nitrosomonas mobilis TaxID=51642 RepID=A0A1G5SBQ1_9PROT|nr:hypothetical protein [Nitrosomonas mobilis]SCZ84240.1 hypothetical protein NSMM_140003 [Nitrosomonas mobilis]HNO76167.1 hypothetical protein [Nitrosomonas mobilis]